MKSETKMIVLGVLTIIFFFIEIVTGLLTGSMALVADSFHMLSDLAALIVAYAAIQLGRKRGEIEGYTYGYKRAEILGAFTNGIILLSLSFTIILNAVERFFDPEFIKNPLIVLIVGCLGFCMNLFGMFLFMGGGDEEGGGGHGHSHGGGGHGGHGGKKKGHHSDEEKLNGHHSSDDSDDSHDSHSDDSHSDDSHDSHSDDSDDSHDSHSTHGGKKKSGGHGGHGGGHGHSHGGGGGSMNFRGIFLHAMSDAIGNFGVIASSLIVLLATGDWRVYMDPAASVLISLVVINSALPLVKSSASLLMQGVPDGIDVDKVRRKIMKIPGVVEIKRLHVWGLSEETNVAGVHIIVRNTSNDIKYENRDPFADPDGASRSNTTLGRLGGGTLDRSNSFRYNSLNRAGSISSRMSTQSRRSLHSNVTYADGKAILSVLDVQHYTTAVRTTLHDDFDIDEATVQVTMESPGDAMKRVAKMKPTDVQNVVLPFLFSVLQPVERRENVKAFHTMVAKSHPKEWDKIKQWMHDSLNEDDYDKLVKKLPHIEEI
ncbi:cation efflux family-domain-containing protein [Zopfochytrium polystomum]|nr:cation efflux family-domain-containing protein [Zopfochytrium polystomum]